MGVRSTTVTASAALLLCAALVACSPDEEVPAQEPGAARLELERAADAMSAILLRPGAERAFARKGHPVAAPLTCTAGPSPAAEPGEGGEDTAGEEDLSEEVTAGAEQDPGAAGEGRLEVSCTGRGRDGEELRFEGRLLPDALAERTAGDDSLRGEFTGTAGGEEVFRMDCFQCSPASPESPAPGEGAAADSTEASPTGAAEAD